MDAAHLRIAITTNSLVAVDANFASAKQMVFYDVTRDASEFVDVVKFNRFGKKGLGGGGGGADGRCVMDDMGDDDGMGHDPLVERVESLAGCSVVFTLGLSDLAAVRIHNERVFPVKSAKGARHRGRDPRIPASHERNAAALAAPRAARRTRQPRAARRAGDLNADGSSRSRERPCH